MYYFSTEKINTSIFYSWSIKNINKQICQEKMNQLRNLEPMMSVSEKTLLYEGFNRSHTYFEIGSGTSTFQAVKHGLKVISVESDAGWYKKMNSIFPTECDINYILIDFHITYNSGYPCNKTTKEEMYQYTHQYKPEFNADMILIDGRFRVACALNILPYIDNTSDVYIHDFERESYHFVMKYYDWIEQAGSLVRLRKKKCCATLKELSYYQDQQI